MIAPVVAPVVASVLAAGCVGCLALAARSAERDAVRMWARSEHAGAEPSRRRTAGRPFEELRELDPHLRRSALALAGCLLGLGLAGVPGAFVGAGGGLALPTVARRRRAARERALLDEQLAEAVSSVAAGMRAGLSLAQSLRYAADESDPPLAISLRAAVDRAQLGVSLGESIDTWSHQHGGRDVRLVAGVLALHRRSGGDLPSVLDALSRTLGERRDAAREVRSLTAQARMSGAILGLLPLAFFGFLAITAREDLETALASPAGLTAIVVGLVMQGLAFAWIRHLLRVEPAT